MAMKTIEQLEEELLEIEARLGFILAIGGAIGPDLLAKGFEIRNELLRRKQAT